MNKLLGFIDLNTGEEDKEKVLNNVKANISFRGSNLWILACAIVIASIGLNVNSTAVIIGAMLISPLMGPIIGAGFSLGIFDFALLRKSLKNLFIATIVSLLVATIYFFLSPFKETQSELLARTSPNIYDVLIAFFGGLVGVIAITRVEKGNPIPGVAIATALMPPLCTAGYGLAIGNFKFFLGALFLYTINCVFICIATFFIVKYLKYPAAEQVHSKHQKQVRYGITALIILMILPSIYLAYNLLNEKRYNQKVNEFVANEFSSMGYTIIYKKLNFNTNPKNLELAFLNKRFDEKEIKKLTSKLTSYKILNTQLKIVQDTTDIRNIILREINGSKNLVDEKDLKIVELNKSIDLYRYDNKSILGEVKILFPEIKNLSLSNHLFDESTDSMRVVAVMLYKSKTDLSETTKTKLTLWLKQKLKKEELIILKQN
ncbi:TIGR00341 family protein [Pedobacter cryophilus]|uniref:TIGR00341 family protein n=1 Tax=Pedobacter cryophilus TaxID=2571271 RepID=A0A4U1C192_9SPHI|nr:TIGR00341 family protein [Pedobacter cryophilus]TKB98981.1 TIGR00341 family protein [Pedobacter cryophilus]